MIYSTSGPIDEIREQFDEATLELAKATTHIINLAQLLGNPKFEKRFADLSNKSWAITKQVCNLHIKFEDRIAELMQSLEPTKD